MNKRLVVCLAAFSLTLLVIALFSNKKCAVKETFESPGMQLDLGGLTTIEFRDAERRRQTTPGKTSAQFFESKLPGFEERYKESPFFRLEQQRKEGVAERETEQKQREYETQRRRRLRSGGGRGRTVVTRGRA